jgi:hypothetical protein
MNLGALGRAAQEKVAREKVRGGVAEGGDCKIRLTGHLPFRIRYITFHIQGKREGSAHRAKSLSWHSETPSASRDWLRFYFAMVFVISGVRVVSLS